MGVIFAKPDKNDRIIEVARNSERGLEESDEQGEGTDDASSVNSVENPAGGTSEADDDVTLAANGGADQATATAESGSAAGSGNGSGVELNEDNTGGNE
jgi:DNA gyrase subunit A